ncbi:hypothetical protein [Roseivirga misakiensis]|uniref:Uncharacterized protein n=1 Tax=Roseivirga misakiensis TaxID=1563681 RepID=A0A1E5T5R7_9BACT|nr:hypothetical protein [Roseivirga misakiensis]OEK06713.1 hypothetical protein BFP71_03360 [Roseivirga misakiensis]
MAEPKARTLIQQLGFFDKDLKTSSHDEIMIWLQENAHSAINRLFYTPWSDGYLDLLIRQTKQQLKDCIPELEKRMSSKKRTEADYELLGELKKWNGLKEQLERKPFQIQKIEWEKAIDQLGHNSKKFTIGFIDMAITYSYQDIWINGIPYNRNDQFDISNYSIPQWATDLSTETIYVEVKTKIPSAGELMRQLNLYRNYRPGTYVVVSPDKRFKDILSNQGISFLAPFT